MQKHGNIGRGPGVGGNAKNNEKLKKRCTSREKARMIKKR
jgi:hypothetical protein